MHALLKKILTSSSILFGIGKIPVAPGTIGSFVAITFLYLSNFFISLSSYTLVFVAIVFLGFIYGIYSTSIAEEKYGHDASCIIIDEFWGQLTVFLFFPEIEIWQYITGFILFRFFDIIKPLGINKIQNFSSGLGIMSDDLLAGLYSLGLLHLISYYY